MPIPSCSDTNRMGQESGSEKPIPRGNPVASRTILVVVFGVLIGIERVTTLRWGVPVWSVFAFGLLVVALAIQRLLARFQSASSALRPLTLISVAVAGVVTVMVVFYSQTPSDRLMLLVWLVPAALAGADVVWPRLPANALAPVVACLLTVVVAAQLMLVRQAHVTQSRADAFHDRLT